jgi:hypothetical protein
VRWGRRVTLSETMVSARCVEGEKGSSAVPKGPKGEKRPAPTWVYPAARLHAVRGSITMSLMRFWSDLSMWNKFGLAAVGAVVVVAIIALVLP